MTGENPLESSPSRADPANVPAAAPRAGTVASVLIESKVPRLDRIYDYAIPERLAGKVLVGQRVKVALGARRNRANGYVVALSDKSEYTGKLQEIGDIAGPFALLQPEIWRLIRALADRAGGSAGSILRHAIPARTVKVEKEFTQSQGFVREKTGEDSPRDADAAARERKNAFAAATAEHPHLSASLLAGKRLHHIASHGVNRLASGEWVASWAQTFTSLAAAAYAQGRSTIAVVPDYRDLGQLRHALETVLPPGALVLVDSRQAQQERYRAFLRCLGDEPRVVVGMRSAIYWPAAKLGQILLWQDADELLREPLAPYVHARDAVLMRQSLSGVGLFAASYTRSLAVHRLVRIGYVQAVSGVAKRTPMTHADFSAVPDSVGGRVPSEIVRVIRRGLTRGPVLVQVAVPGFAPQALCPSCGELARCGECGGPLHFADDVQASCRWCARPALGWRCPGCGGVSVPVASGAGSRRTVWQFERQFPGVRVLVSDGDSPLLNVDVRPALVVATRGAEPVAAGGYSAVVLLDVWRELAREGLSAAEDCLRHWHGAAALAAADGVCCVAAGAGDALHAFLSGREFAWLDERLRDAVELKFPPAVRVASVRGGALVCERAVAELSGLAGVDCLGPVSVGDGVKRVIVRFSYASGGDVARRLRALQLEAGAGSGRVELRFDDSGVFDV